MDKMLTFLFGISGRVFFWWQPWGGGSSTQTEPSYRGVVHSQIGCTDFKSSKKSLDFSDFFWIFRIFSDFSDFLDFFRIFRIFWIFRIFFGFFGFFSDFLDFFRIFWGGVRRLKKKNLFPRMKGLKKVKSILRFKS